jgi:hypothetical protein
MRESQRLAALTRSSASEHRLHALRFGGEGHKKGGREIPAAG